MRVLGIDPGSRIIGYGVLHSPHDPTYVASGIIRLSTGAVEKRMMEIYQCISDLIGMYTPSHVAIEEVFMHKNVKSALMLKQARGAIWPLSWQNLMSVLMPWFGETLWLWARRKSTNASDGHPTVCRR